MHNHLHGADADWLREPARRDLLWFPVVYSKWKHVAAVR